MDLAEVLWRKRALIYFLLLDGFSLFAAALLFVVPLSQKLYLPPYPIGVCTLWRFLVCGWPFRSEFFQAHFCRQLGMLYQDRGFLRSLDDMPPMVWDFVAPFKDHASVFAYSVDGMPQDWNCERLALADVNPHASRYLSLKTRECFVASY